MALHVLIKWFLRGLAADLGGLMPHCGLFVGFGLRGGVFCQLVMDRLASHGAGDHVCNMCSLQFLELVGQDLNRTVENCPTITRN